MCDWGLYVYSNEQESVWCVTEVCMPAAEAPGVRTVCPIRAQHLRQAFAAYSGCVWLGTRLKRSGTALVPCGGVLWLCVAGCVQSVCVDVCVWCWCVCVITVVCVGGGVLCSECVYNVCVWLHLHRAMSQMFDYSHTWWWSKSLTTVTHGGEPNVWLQSHMVVNQMFDYIQSHIAVNQMSDYSHTAVYQMFDYIQSHMVVNQMFDYSHTWQWTKCLTTVTHGGVPNVWLHTVTHGGEANVWLQSHMAVNQMFDYSQMAVNQMSDYSHTWRWTKCLPTATHDVNQMSDYSHTWRWTKCLTTVTHGD